MTYICKLPSLDRVAWCTTVVVNVCVCVCVEVCVDLGLSVFVCCSYKSQQGVVNICVCVLFSRGQRSKQGRVLLFLGASAACQADGSMLPGPSLAWTLVTMVHASVSFFITTFKLIPHTGIDLCG